MQKKSLIGLRYFQLLHQRKSRIKAVKKASNQVKNNQRIKIVSMIHLINKKNRLKRIWKEVKSYKIELTLKKLQIGEQ